MIAGQIAASSLKATISHKKAEKLLDPPCPEFSFSSSCEADCNAIGALRGGILRQIPILGR